MKLLRSIAHLVWMAITVIPWALFVVVVSYFVSSSRLYWICAGWLRLAVNSGTWILGIENRIQGMENLPQGSKDPAVLLVKHQSTWETFVMPAIMPHPLAYVFKKELLSVPFFGWAMGRLDMIHIDRKQRSRAFAKVVQQGRRLMEEGVWVIMFPEGTRIPVAKRANTKAAVPAWPLPRACRSFRLRSRRRVAGRPARSSRPRAWSTSRSAKRLPAKAAVPKN